MYILGRENNYTHYSSARAVPKTALHDVRIVDCVNPAILYPFIALTAWGLLAFILMVRLWRSRSTDAVNLYWYQSIPSGFTAIGVLGTFLGIYLGLMAFDVATIDASIPPLLEGLKGAFITSLVGISLSIVFRALSEWVLHRAEADQPAKPDSELGALNAIRSLLEKQEQLNNNHRTKLLTALDTQQERTSSMQLSLESGLTHTAGSITASLRQLETAIGGTTEESLALRMARHHDEQLAAMRTAAESRAQQVELSKANATRLTTKLDEFGQMLEKSNTDALVQVMRNVTEQFSAQMNELISRLVQENFAALNTSVQRMNTWQQEHKEMVRNLTERYHQLSAEFDKNATTLKAVAEHTKALTTDEGKLAELVRMLRTVMIDDQKFERVTKELLEAAGTMHRNTVAFDEMSNKLNKGIKNQMLFNEGVTKLLAKLEEVSKIKDHNDEFWQQTRKQLQEGVNLVAQANKQLANDVDTINTEFYTRLNSTFTQLDSLIQSTINHHTVGI